MASKTLKRKIAAISILTTLFAVWTMIDSPRSIEEYLFLKNLKDTPEQRINLALLNKREWETVCSMPGYGGDLYLEKYKKTYTPAGAMQDGVWALRFIRSDGTSIAVSGTCNQTGAYIKLDKCVVRNDAVLALDEKSSLSCRTYEPKQ